MPANVRCRANKTGLVQEDCDYPNCGCEEWDHPRKQGNRLGPLVSRPAQPSPEGLSLEERVIWHLGEMATGFENFYGAPCPKRGGHINIAAAKIIDEYAPVQRDRANVLLSEENDCLIEQLQAVRRQREDLAASLNKLHQEMALIKVGPK